MDELSEEDKLTVARARKIQRFLSQPFQVAEVFTGHAGKLVTMEQTISGFTEILSGKYDHLPEVAFYMVGDISEVSLHMDKNLSFLLKLILFLRLLLRPKGWPPKPHKFTAVAVHLFSTISLVNSFIPYNIRGPWSSHKRC